MRLAGCLCSGVCARAAAHGGRRARPCGRAVSVERCVHAAAARCANEFVLTRSWLPPTHRGCCARGTQWRRLWGRARRRADGTEPPPRQQGAGKAEARRLRQRRGGLQQDGGGRQEERRQPAAVPSRASRNRICCIVASRCSQSAANLSDCAPHLTRCLVRLPAVDQYRINIEV